MEIYSINSPFLRDSHDRDRVYTLAVFGTFIKQIDREFSSKAAMEIGNIRSIYHTLNGFGDSGI